MVYTMEDEERNRLLKIYRDITSFLENKYKDAKRQIYLKLMKQNSLELCI